jgi:hypothetical protein
MLSSYLVFAYFSPETLLPVTSIVATIAGIVLMLGRGSLRFIIGCCRLGVRRASRIAGVSRPHFRVRKTTYSQSSDR